MSFHIKSLKSGEYFTHLNLGYPYFKCSILLGSGGYWVGVCVCV